MITIFHVLWLTAICLGLVLGAVAGAKLLGVFGAIVGGIAGGYLGFVVGRVPWFLALRFVARKFEKNSTAELRAELHSPQCMILNCLLLELRRRGEDIQQELPVVLDCLVSKSEARRGFGWATLTSAYPELAAQIRDYCIKDSMEECRRKTEILRHVAG
jgi:hypothetical protein